MGPSKPSSRNYPYASSDIRYKPAHVSPRLQISREVAEEELPSSKLPKWRTSIPKEQEMEKRKAKPISLMSPRLGKILEGEALASKMGHFLYSDEEAIRVCLVGSKLPDLIAKEIRGPIYTWPYIICPKP